MGSSRNKYNEKCGDKDDGSCSSNMCGKVRIPNLSTWRQQIDWQIFPESEEKKISEYFHIRIS
ncbi:hypothetical protein PFDG_05196 [Plasmodium falciparum Dd2]|uniref:Uncharacterized protein n=1 Tax=Plasmodium falciparum (isolate Dd2) TaxID=57267 RepID=A0A0L7M9Z5_PLAF4|nr:hypothetical protein PFDG_05196 [Plasmodium falciparum Dd2]